MTPMLSPSFEISIAASSHPVGAFSKSISISFIKTHSFDSAVTAIGRANKITKIMNILFFQPS